jgi:hypothetical protein
MRRNLVAKLVVTCLHCLPLACCLLAPQQPIVAGGTNDYSAKIQALETAMQGQGEKLDKTKRELDETKRELGATKREMGETKREMKKMTAELKVYELLSQNLDESRHRERRLGNVLRPMSGFFQILIGISSASPIVDDYYDAGKSARDSHRKKLREKAPAERIQTDSDGRHILKRPNPVRWACLLVGNSLGRDLSFP